MYVYACGVCMHAPICHLFSCSRQQTLAVTLIMDATSMESLYAIFEQNVAVIRSMVRAHVSVCTHSPGPARRPEPRAHVGGAVQGDRPAGGRAQGGVVPHLVAVAGGHKHASSRVACCVGRSHGRVVRAAGVITPVHCALLLAVPSPCVDDACAARLVVHLHTISPAACRAWMDSHWSVPLIMHFH